MNTKKKTILFAIDSMAGGGAEKVLIALLKNLNREKFAIDLFLFVREGPNVKKIPEDVNVFYLFDSFEKPENRFKRFFRTKWRSILLRIIKKMPFIFSWFVSLPRRYDVGVSFCEGLNLLLFTGLEKYFKRKLSWIHIDIAKHKFVLDEKCLGKNIEKFDKIIFISKAILAIFGRVFPNIPENKFQCIYNPIDVELILKRGEEDTSFFATPKTGLRVLSMGRLAQMKRFDLLISACARLRKEGHAVELFIFGYGKEEAALKALITELGEDEFLKIMPYQENPYSLMRQADVFVSSSDYEGLPLVITEAMILGVPILATRTPGAEELLENGKYGALVGFSEKEIHDGLLGFLLNPTRLLDYRQNLLESRQNFPFNSSVSKIEELLEIEI